MEEDENIKLNLPTDDSFLELGGSNAVGDGDDSNSLEPGEVVEEKTPPRSDTGEDKILSNEGSTNVSIEAAGNNISPSKPVLGKEKAKQRLKVLGIQKKIQMESKNIRTSQKRKKSRDKNGSSFKKEKPPTPHEKAKLTKEEIEKLKENQDCAIPCLYYDAAMIHHIRVECPEEKQTTSKIESCLTASLEAIKNYEDQEEAPTDTEKSFKRRKYIDENARNYKGIKRNLFCSKIETFVSGIHEKGRKKPNLNRKRLIGSSFKNLELNSNEQERIKARKHLDLSDPRKQENRAPKLYDALKTSSPIREGVKMWTKTKPSLSFTFNWDTIALQKLQPVIVEEQKRKKGKKKLKKKREGRKKRRSKSQVEGVERKNKTIKKKSKKRNHEERDERDKKEKKKKGRKKKMQISRGALSFPIDEFYPEENIENFPLSKDEIVAVPEVEDDDTALENKLKSLQEELNKKSPSPDTDDYMANWEEEDFVSIPMSKDSTPKVGNGLKASDEEQRTTEAKDAKILDNEDVSSVMEAQCDDNEAEIKDGLGTPIFVNPSPPEELFAIVKTDEVKCSKTPTPKVEAFLSSDIIDIETTLKRPKSPLFGMQIIYEQFIQSVNEAGIELSLEQRHSNKDNTDTSIPSTREEENSFTPNTSPRRPIITDEITFDETSPMHLPKSNISSSRSRSSTRSPSSTSSSSSSSSSSSTSSTENGNNGDNRSVPGLMEREKNMQKVTSSIDSQLSVLSPEDSQKLRSLQNRWRMLKTLQEQSDAMDDEDIQCLLGLEKLIEAEKNLLMRKYDLNKKGKGSSDEEEKVSDLIDSGVSLCSVDVDTTLTFSLNDDTKNPREENEKSEDLNKIFDANRETIKLTISSKIQKSVVPKVTYVDKKSDEDDQDFTEKLIRPSKDVHDSPERNDAIRSSRERHTRKYSSSASRSPEFRRTVRRGRSLSVSPDKRGHSHIDRYHRSQRRRYSPSQRQFRLGSPMDRKRRDSKLNRERKRSLSPEVRRRSRSPYFRRFSRSPTFRPPSPKSPPPPSTDSRSPLEEESPALDDPPSSVHNYLWSEDSSSHYYTHANGYYYSHSSSHSTLDDGATNRGNQQPIRSYPDGSPYPNYSQYNAYPSDYSAMSGYANNYGNEYISSEPMNSYSCIPVINSSGANYYYNEFDSEQSYNNNISSGNNNNKQIVHHQDSGGRKGTPFVVQKGNVLEIVPTSIIPKQESEPEGSIKISLTIEKDEKGEKLEQTKIESVQPEEEQQQQQIKSEKIEEKRKRRKSIDNGRWEDEVAKRHIMSAVLRLNKEGDCTLRGILCNKTNSDTQLKNKKKVLFADGIAPGDSSSTSDEEILYRKSIRKRSKKKRRRKGNKENENISKLNPADLITEFKVDLELENAPPPPAPPGSPPPHLEQPILIRPPSPDQLLYFHYDNVVNSMYVSQLATPIPPRLLNRGIPPILPQFHNRPKTSAGNIVGSKENISKKCPSDTIKQSPKECARLEIPNQNVKESNDDQFIIQFEHGNDTKIPFSPQANTLPSNAQSLWSPSPTPPPPLHPIENVPINKGIILQDRKNPMNSRPISPVITGFSGFNKPPPRSTLPSIRQDFSVPPPSPQPQPMLTHPSIPFGPRPPGGTANFNRNVPPPQSPHIFRSQGIPSSYNNSRENSPSPALNVMTPKNFSQTDCHMSPSHLPPFRPSGISLPFNNPANHGNILTFSTPNVVTSSNFGQNECHLSQSPVLSVRPTRICSPFRNPANLENPSVYSGGNVLPPSFTPPPPVNAKPIPTILGKHMGSSQFHHGNSPLMNNPTPPNFNTNNLPNMFSPNGILSQIHRPNLGFPRSFGPQRPPPPPQHITSHQRHHMFGNQSVPLHPNQAPTNTLSYPQRPMFSSSVHHF